MTSQSGKPSKTRSTMTMRSKLAKQWLDRQSAVRLRDMRTFLCSEWDSKQQAPLMIPGTIPDRDLIRLANVDNEKDPGMIKAVRLEDGYGTWQKPVWQNGHLHAYIEYMDGSRSGVVRISRTRCTFRMDNKSLKKNPLNHVTLAVRIKAAKHIDGFEQNLVPADGQKHLPPMRDPEFIEQGAESPPDNEVKTGRRGRPHNPPPTPATLPSNPREAPEEPGSPPGAPVDDDEELVGGMLYRWLPDQTVEGMELTGKERRDWLKRNARPDPTEVKPAKALPMDQTDKVLGNLDGETRDEILGIWKLDTVDIVPGSDLESKCFDLIRKRVQLAREAADNGSPRKVDGRPYTIEKINVEGDLEWDSSKMEFKRPTKPGFRTIYLTEDEHETEN